MNLSEAVRLFGLPSDFFIAIVKSLKDEKVLATNTHEDFAEYSAFA